MNKSEYELNRYYERMDDALEYLGGKCIQCGTKEKLEFDHIDPATKAFTISSGWSYSLDTFYTELDKCQLLCEQCHKKKHHPNELSHGLSKYKHHKCRCDVCMAAMRQYTRQYRLTHSRKD